MAPAKIHIGRYLWGMGATALTLLTGLWLILAPFALGYQAGNAAGWTGMTENDFWIGIGVAVLAAIGFGFFTLGLLATLRAGGVLKTLPRRPRRQLRPQPAPATAAPNLAPYRTDLDELGKNMAALAAALTADLAERRKSPNDHVAESITMGGKQ